MGLPNPALDGWLSWSSAGSPSINPLTGSVSQATAALALAFAVIATGPGH